MFSVNLLRLEMFITLSDFTLQVLFNTIADKHSTIHGNLFFSLSLKVLKVFEGEMLQPDVLNVASMTLFSVRNFLPCHVPGQHTR